LVGHRAGRLERPLRPSAATTAVILVNWNRWRDTLEAVRSVQAMRPAPGWVVVVENGSTDDSLEQLRAHCTGVELIHTAKNLGFGSGNNLGIRWALERGASGVWLLNNDAVADPAALGEILQLAEARPGVGTVGTRIYRADQREVLQCWGGGWANLWTGRSSEFDHEVPDAQLDYITGCSMYLPRAALERSGPFDEGYFMYFEDVDLGFRYRAQGWTLAVARGAKVWHQGGASTAGSPKQSAWRTQSLLRFFRLHAPNYPSSLALSTALRTASFARRRNWVELQRLLRDVPRFAATPDWRGRPEGG
jgi:GT2 family glycosyltransferase